MNTSGKRKKPKPVKAWAATYWIVVSPYEAFECTLSRQRQGAWSMFRFSLHDYDNDNSPAQRLPRNQGERVFQAGDSMTSHTPTAPTAEERAREWLHGHMLDGWTTFNLEKLTALILDAEKRGAERDRQRCRQTLHNAGFLKASRLITLDALPLEPKP